MISIVTAYYNRKKLLIRTLESLRECYGKIEFEMIVVDDGSKEEERLEDLTDQYPYLRICRIDPSEKWYSNPCIPYNNGFELVKGDKIILQNPECYHFDNILEYVDKYLKSNEYLCFGCFSLDKETTDNSPMIFDQNKINSLIGDNPNVVKVDGGLGWYNHSRYRPAALHFCSAITTEDLVDLGGFDPRFALGHGYDDNELIFRIRLKGMKVKYVDEKVVLHQNHYLKQLTEDEQKVKLLNEKATRNKLILETITYRSRTHRANYLSINGVMQKKDFSILDIIRKIKSKLRNI